MRNGSGRMNEVIRQQTLKSAIHCSGVGLHSGQRVAMTLRPAEANTGIVFRRSDPSGAGAELPAHWENAIETPLCTTLVHKSGARIATIEHLMSAFAGCGIDNAIVELSGAEVPIMDGSAAPFVFLIECAGVDEQDAPRRAIEVLKEVVVHEPHRSASLRPSNGLSLSFEIDFDSTAVARQSWSVQVSESRYKSEVARARTFGFLHEVDKLRAQGLALGGSLDNAIVISGDEILNEGGLRFDNEFVRHKVLDSIGDLYLMGGPLLGHFHGLRAGHALTLRLVKALFADVDAWRWREMTREQLSGHSLEAAGSTGAPARAVAARA